MADDVVIDKVATIERCCLRAREEYDNAAGNFAQDFTRQDAAILNIQRACEAAIDLASYLVRHHRLGVPQSSRDAFDLLTQAGHISADMADVLKKMVGFRNTAVHNYQKMHVPIVTAIIEQHLDDLKRFAHLSLRLE